MYRDQALGYIASFLGIHVISIRPLATVNGRIAFSTELPTGIVDIRLGVPNGALDPFGIVCCLRSRFAGQFPAAKGRLTGRDARSQ
jgi:hypothetical protein